MTFHLNTCMKLFDHNDNTKDMYHYKPWKKRQELPIKHSALFIPQSVRWTFPSQCAGIHLSLPLAERPHIPPYPLPSNHNYYLKRLYFYINLKGLYLFLPLLVGAPSLTLSISINQQLLLTCTQQFSHQSSPSSKWKQRGNICSVKSTVPVFMHGNPHTHTYSLLHKQTNQSAGTSEPLPDHHGKASQIQLWPHLSLRAQFHQQ